ncbi:hypothetical protein C1D09_006590 [Mesorhizobium intechi]|uniref:Uncharacterized protein n=1 Tax=Mesorhizobium intechi TaxID=537601 RepID=A0A8T9AVX0_9HYPH|nr:hypothetical protein [Mesorhizobium intechi]TSE12930.1 hypothetical protein C1D09_006590 [Mesorhizobium intechi]
MKIQLTNYLGGPVSNLLSSSPFKLWKFERSVDSDIPITEIDYTSKENGLAVVCDENDDINSIFIDADNFDQVFFEVLFSSRRKEIQNIFGTPTRSGAAHIHSILGEYGPWDRFDVPRHSIHIEYRPHVDKIKRVTLMRAGVAP